MDQRAMGVVERVLETWRASSVELNPGAGPRDMDRLREVLGTELPDDVRRFYGAANGMVDYDAAGESMVSFWSIDRICRECDIVSGSDSHGNFRDVAFADVLIYSWCFRYRVRAQGLCVVADELPGEYGDLDSFLETYLSSPSRLNVD